MACGVCAIIPDYPAEKLDVILAVEADDHETRAAIEAAQRRLSVTVVPVPVAAPRTKPKALNVALPFARGTFTVIYDAEDRPEPDQLRRALQTFRSGGDDLACVQARLCIDNTADSWLTRLFTAEYAAQFDVFLDGLTHLQLPLPLGGSSNHFYTATLREVGAWDPYNVTEDADLGMRLARFGYRAAMIDSTTYEEAPARFRPWLRQRTRWFKGWMQTVNRCIRSNDFSDLENRGRAASYSLQQHRNKFNGPSFPCHYDAKQREQDADNSTPSRDHRPPEGAARRFPFLHRLFSQPVLHVAASHHFTGVSSIQGGSPSTSIRR